MITSVINPKGRHSDSEFSRVDEYIFFVLLRRCRSSRRWPTTCWTTTKSEAADTSVKWSSLIRGRRTGRTRRQRPKLFYPVFVDVGAGRIHSRRRRRCRGRETRAFGDSPAGTVAVWPIRHPTASRGAGGIGPEHGSGATRDGRSASAARSNATPRQVRSSYLSVGTIMDKVASGEIVTDGTRAAMGRLIVTYRDDAKVTQPKTVWNDAAPRRRRRTGTHAPDDAASRPQVSRSRSRCTRSRTPCASSSATSPTRSIVDFFAGSGTTAHAVMRLNKQDGGRRQSILVTNNEVSRRRAEGAAREGTATRGLRSGSSWGICEYITKPRIAAAITGKTPDGEPIKGDYKFTDEFPMADGFEENVEFFTLTYEAPLRVASQPRVRQDRAAAVAAGRLARVGGSTTSRPGGTSPTRTA